MDMRRDFFFIMSLLICTSRAEGIPAQESTETLAADGSSPSAVVLYTTEAFFYPIRKEAFGQDVFGLHEVEYMPSVQGMPDLPKWMSYKYPNGSRNAFLYGSPQNDGDVDIEIVAMNKYNYDTFRDVVKFRILEKEQKAKYNVELKLSNMNIEEFFVGNRVAIFLAIFQDKLWKESPTVYVTMIAAPSDVGGRLPLDPKDKEGVLVRIGSTEDFSRDLLDLEREVEPIKNRNPCPRKYKATSAEYLFRSKDLIVDWCTFQLIRSTTVTRAPEDQVEDSFLNIDGQNFIEVIDDGQDAFEAVDAAPHRLKVRDRDYGQDLLYCAIAPLVLGLVLIPCLVGVFFYKEQLEKFGRQTPAEQLQQYESLQRVHSQLRQLAANRDALPSTS